MYAYMGIDWEKLREYRREKALAILRDRGLAAVVIADSTNVRYVAGLRNYGAPELFGELHFVILNEKDELYVFTQIFADKLKQLPWVKESYSIPAWRKAAMQQDVRSDLIVQALHDMGIDKGRIGIDSMPFQVKDKLAAKAPEFAFVSVHWEFQEARLIKSEDEIALMELAATNNEVGARAALDAICEGASEHDIVAAIIQAMAKAGSEGLTHYPGVRSGERTLTDFLPAGRKLRRGDTVIFDIGNYGIGGYACDFCRTGIVGRPTDRAARCYQALYEAHMKGIEAVKPGVRASHVHEVINASLRKAGYPESSYANGHGIGIGMVELPTIASKDQIPQDMELRAGMTICLEPITFVEEGAIKLEDVVLVTEADSKVLTRTEYWDNV